MARSPVAITIDNREEYLCYHVPLEWLSSIMPVRLLLPLCVVTPLTVFEPPSFQCLFVVAPVTLFLPPCVVTPVASSVVTPVTLLLPPSVVTSVERIISLGVWAWLINMRMRIIMRVKTLARVRFACACWRASLRNQTTAGRMGLVFHLIRIHPC